MEDICSSRDERKRAAAPLPDPRSSREPLDRRQFRVGVTGGAGVVMGAPVFQELGAETWPELSWL